MILLTPQMKIMVHIAPIDFRCGIDSLVGLTKSKLKEDPFSGAVFVFRNKRSHCIKMIVYDGQGFWLLQKRLSEGKFLHWPKQKSQSAADEGGSHVKLLARELSVLLWNGNPERSMMSKDWKKLDP